MEEAMSKKVLVIDDSRTVRQQVGIVLTAAGYSVLEAGDGIEGVERIAEHADIAMVICDVNMPRMTGLEMLSTLKREGKTADLSIVMLTTEGQPSAIAKARECGAKGWLVKPFKPDMLLATVKKMAGPA
jgi:two-component system, chemotaxis family, chemotaxis protein CheY